MMEYIIPLNFPPLSTTEHTLLRNYFYDNLEKGSNPPKPYQTYFEPNSYYNVVISNDQKQILKKGFLNGIFRTDTEVQLQYAKMDHMPPHCDTSRNLILLYLVDNDSAFTKYFTHPNGPSPSTGFKLAELTLTHTYKMKLHTWYLVNTQQIHAVFESGDKPRIGLCICLDTLYSDFGEASHCLKQFVTSW